MTECRSEGLCERRAEGAARLRGRAGVDPYGRGTPARMMAEFVNRSALLRHHQQQQESKWFEDAFHSIWRSPTPDTLVNTNAMSSALHFSHGGAHRRYESLFLSAFHDWVYCA